MRAFNYKMIFSTVLLITSSLFEHVAMAESNPPMFYHGLNVYQCDRTVTELFPAQNEPDKTAIENHEFFIEQQTKARNACEKYKSPFFVMCAMDLSDQTYVGERNSNGQQLQWGDYNIEYLKLRKVSTLEAVCGSARDWSYKSKVSCVSNLFLRGGLRMASDDPSEITGVKMCTLNNSNLNDCITNKYKTRRYSGQQAAKECLSEYNNSVQVSKGNSGNLTDADNERAAREARDARDAYNRARGLTAPSEPQNRQAEPAQQKQQVQQQSDASSPIRTEAPASSISSSGGMIEDLPSL